jgi:hypothetical protein
MALQSILISSKWKNWKVDSKFVIRSSFKFFEVEFEICSLNLHVRFFWFAVCVWFFRPISISKVKLYQNFNALNISSLRIMKKKTAKMTDFFIVYSCCNFWLPIESQIAWPPSVLLGIGDYIFIASFRVQDHSCESKIN